MPCFIPVKIAGMNTLSGRLIKVSIIDLTPTGRATVVLLELNRERALRIRAADIVVGRHPPKYNNIQQER